MTTPQEVMETILLNNMAHHFDLPYILKLIATRVDTATGQSISALACELQKSLPTNYNHFGNEIKYTLDAGSNFLKVTVDFYMDKALVVKLIFTVHDEDYRAEFHYDSETDPRYHLSWGDEHWERSARNATIDYMVHLRSVTIGMPLARSSSIIDEIPYNRTVTRLFTGYGRNALVEAFIKTGEK